MTMTLSERIAQMTARNGPDSGWVDRTRAGIAIQNRKIGSSAKSLDYARSAHELAAIDRAKAENELLQEQAHSTGRSLSDLADAADAAKKKFEATSDALARATSNYDKVRASALSKTDLVRLQKSSQIVESASERKASTRGRLAHVQGAIDAERANPTGMSADDMALLEDAAQYLKLQYEDASDSLTRLTAEQDKLRASIDSQLRFRDNMSKEDFDATSESSGAVQAATDARNAIQKKLHDIADEFEEKAFSHGGISQQDSDRLRAADDRYRIELDKATAALEKLTKAHEDDVQAAIRHSRAQNASSDRQPQTALGRAARRISSNFRRKLGSRGRQFLNRGSKFKKDIQKQLDRFNPKKVRKRIEDSKREHEEAESEYKKNQTPANKLNLDNKMATLTEAESDAALAESAGLAVEALGAVAAVVGVLVAAVAASVQFIQNELAAGKREVERFRSERSRFSAQVSGAIARYDMQSIQLERRSTAATSGSATGAVKATMRLRESNQGRSEKYEVIGNQILEQSIAIATMFSDGLAIIDFITPSIEALVTVQREMLKMIGVKLEDISKNTRNGDLNVGLDVIKQLNNDNRNARQNKAFPPLKPIK